MKCKNCGEDIEGNCDECGKPMKKCYCIMQGHYHTCCEGCTDEIIRDNVAKTEVLA